MKTYCIGLILVSTILTGCASSEEARMLSWGVASIVYTGYDDVRTGLMKHGYAQPGMRYPDFEAAIEKAEDINHVSAEFNASPNFGVDHSYLFKYEGSKAVYYGRFVADPNYKPEFKPTFSTGEISNVTAFVKKLQSPSNQVSVYLMSRFSESNRLVIEGFPEPGVEEKALDALLTQELNGIVSGPSIYDEERFRGVKLRPAILQLLSFHGVPRPAMTITSEQMNALVNRMLLEDSYRPNVPYKRQTDHMRQFVAVKY